jgi:putative endonuclease
MTVGGKVRDPKQPCVYMLATRKHGTLYTGVTSDLLARVYQHRARAAKGFTATYESDRLVWYEVYETMETAITREKRIKKWLREWECNLIEVDNPDWVDLALGLGFRASSHSA